MDELLRWNNKRLVLHLLVAAACFGIIEGLLGLTDPPPRGLDLAETVSINFVIFYWIGMDSKIRNYSTSGFFRVMVVILGVILLFYYVIRTRGIRAGLRSLVYAVGLSVVMVVTWGISGMLTFAIVTLVT